MFQYPKAFYYFQLYNILKSFHIFNSLLSIRIINIIMIRKTSASLLIFIHLNEISLHRKLEIIDCIRYTIIVFIAMVRKN